MGSIGPYNNTHSEFTIAKPIIIIIRKHPSPPKHHPELCFNYPISIINVKQLLIIP